MGQKPSYASPRPLWRFLAVALIGLLTEACTNFDPLDQTGEQVNRAETDYANDATLLNVVRASMSESPTFVTITGLDGTASATGSLGFGGFTLGPHVHTAPHSFLLGADSFQRSNSNTVHMSVVDDPASFVALSSPVNPAVIAFFVRQGFAPAMLFFMLVDEVDEMQLGNDGKTTNAVAHKYVNRRLDKTYGDFLSVMGTLLNEGLTAQLDVTATPSGRSLPPSRLCIDPSGPRPASDRSFPHPHRRRTIPRYARTHRGSRAARRAAPVVPPEEAAAAPAPGRAAVPSLVLALRRTGRCGPKSAARAKWFTSRPAARSCPSLSQRTW